MFSITKQLTKNSNSSNWNYSIPQLLLLSLQIALSSRASGKQKFKNSKRLVAMVWRHKPVKFPSSLWQLVVNCFQKTAFFVQYLFLLRMMKSVFFFRNRIDCWHLEIGFHISVGKSGKAQFSRGQLHTALSQRNLSFFRARGKRPALSDMVMTFNLVTPSNGFVGCNGWSGVFILKPIEWCHVVSIV